MVFRLLDLVHHNLILESHVDDFQSLEASEDVRAEREALKGEYSLGDVVSSFSECYGVAVSYAWHPLHTGDLTFFGNNFHSLLFKSASDVVAISYGEYHKNAELEEIGVCDELSESQDLCSNIFAEKIIFWSLKTGAPQVNFTFFLIIKNITFLYIFLVKTVELF
jgi:hypothetical protein